MAQITPFLLAQARRRQAGVLLPKRADPYAEEMKRIAEEQKARAAAEKEAAKAAEEQAREAEKARQAAEKAALAAENNAKEAQYRREKRPMYVDANGRIQSQVTDEEWQKQRAQKAKNDELRTRYFQQNRPWMDDANGNISPRQTDEEWQAAQNEKAAKLEAAKVDKANEVLRKERKQEITGVQRGMTDAEKRASRAAARRKGVNMTPAPSPKAQPGFTFPKLEGGRPRVATFAKFKI